MNTSRFSKLVSSLLEKKDEILSSLQYSILPKKAKAYVCFFTVATEIHEDGVSKIKTCSYDDVPLGITVPMEYLDGRFDKLENYYTKCCGDEVAIITHGITLLEAAVRIKKAIPIAASVIGTAIPCRPPYVKDEFHWAVGTSLENASRFDPFLIEVNPSKIQV
ncbi:MAG: hypothetical protein QXW98_04200 [Candidatus Caldarchaeum sp.]